jgi:hypothetical protein
MSLKACCSFLEDFCSRVPVEEFRFAYMGPFNIKIIVVKLVDTGY